MPPKIQVNLDEIPDFVNVAPGRHRAKLVEVTEEQSKSSGEDMWVWHWVVSEGENEGRIIRSYTTLQEHALGGLKMHALAFGYEGIADIDAGKLYGKMAILVVINRKVRSRETGEEMDLASVSNVLPADAKVQKGSNRSQKGRAITSRGESSGGGGGGEDDLPF